MIPVVVQPDGVWEVDALRNVEHDRFLFLKPSLRILDADAFWAALESFNGPAWLFGRPSCYLAVYDRTTLQEAIADAPAPFDKELSIVWESRLHDRLNYPTVWPQAADRNALRIDYIDGRPELVVGVPGVVEKHKGTVRCRRCPTWPSPGICPHVMRRVNAGSAQTR